eukprot:CAMPEP_0180803518 /NCGR_PEP_ID=MMETSP1038_2-20121128/60942_1 /TAXON_ID=632150 /ORGANISM="Azadinium spinosum, Strain 3D9" /LENGTH=55 /DNA_ID=CAMNT_0022843843 /DNA_START=96 /DNA_END=263 /DNA_ORIENTATION=-
MTRSENSSLEMLLAQGSSRCMHTSTLPRSPFVAASSAAAASQKSARHSFLTWNVR